MENLTKQQLILLALLVSFVSSIATGIVTVSLLNQAPPAVTQTINRIIERTVETVRPVEGGTPTVTKETIVVSEDEAVVNAIEKASKSIVRIEGLDNGDDWRFVGIGLVADSTGSIATKAGFENLRRYRTFDQEGKEIELEVVQEGSTDVITIFREKNGALALSALTGAVFADSKAFKLGQKVVAVGGDMSRTVDTGIISGVEQNDTGAVKILTNIFVPELLSSSILVNLSGEVVGIKTGTTVEEGYIPSNLVQGVVAGAR